MPGRGMGEVSDRFFVWFATAKADFCQWLVVDPNLNSVLSYGARAGNGLYKSTNYGVTWTKVSGSPNTGTYIPDPSDTNGYKSDKTG